MSNEFIRPNWHVILIHYPLALLTLGLFIELFSFLWRRHSFRAAGRWMILLGAAMALPAVTSGIYAYRGVLGGDDLPFEDLQAATHLTAPQRDLISDHIKFNVAATVIFLLVVVVWLGCSDNWRRKLHIPLLLLLLIGVGVAGSGAWHGGEMVYHTGLSVDQSPDATPHGKPLESLQQKIEFYAPPLEVHVVLAGLVIAAALVALGLSIRAITSTIEETDDWEAAGIDTPLRPTSPDAGALLAEMAAQERASGTPYPPPPYDPANEISRSSSLNDKTGWSDRSAAPLDLPEYVPSSRFWLLATLLALCTAAAGVWLVGIFNWQQLVDYLKSSQRDAAHSILGVSIVVLTVILAIITRWAYRKKIVLAIFSVLLLLAVAGQIWMGILLMFDTRQGPLTKFNVSEAGMTKTSAGASIALPITTRP